MFEFKYGADLVYALTDISRARIIESLNAHDSTFLDLMKTLACSSESLTSNLEVLMAVGLVVVSEKGSLGNFGINANMKDLVENFLKNTRRLDCDGGTGSVRCSASHMQN